MSAGIHLSPEAIMNQIGRENQVLKARCQMLEQKLEQLAQRCFVQESRQQFLDMAASRVMARLALGWQEDSEIAAMARRAWRAAVELLAERIIIEEPAGKPEPSADPDSALK